MKGRYLMENLFSPENLYKIAGAIHKEIHEAIDRINADFNQFQPKVTLSWAASDQINWYASYGMGFRSGGFNSVGTSDTLNFWFNSGFGGPGEAVDAQLQITDDYDKEISRSIELGVKAEYMDRRVRVNAAVFKTDVDDNQFFEFFAGPFGLLRTVTTIDELTIRGFEVDATFAVTENLSIDGGGCVQRAPSISASQVFSPA